MEELSGLDASFLYLETPKVPMHIGGRGDSGRLAEL